MPDLTEILLDLCGRHAVPGAGIGVVDDDHVETAFTGVTSVDNPLDVDARTLFQVGSVSKTFATGAVLRLVGERRIELDQRVRDLVPELRLADEQVADTVTVRHLLNHTSGWDGTLSSGEEHPDESLAHFVETTLPTLEQVGPLGQRAEYNNAAVALAGRVVEKVTGQPYEQAVRTLLLEPLGMTDTHFTTDDLMTERVAVGHLADHDETYRVARPWRWPRAGNPEGGLVSTLADQLTWARFTLGDGRTPDGVQVLGAPEIAAMRTPSVELLGNPMGDAIGLGWFLRDIGGERTLGHPGATNGQFAELRLVPGRGFGVIACANGGPAGNTLVREAVDTVLAEYLGLRAAPPQFRAYDPAEHGEVGGTYANSLASLEVTVDGDAVAIRFVLNPEVAARSGDSAPTFAPGAVHFVGGDRGEYVIGDGEFEGMTGAFVREDTGEVLDLAFGGRWYRRRGADDNERHDLLRSP